MPDSQTMLKIKPKHSATGNTLCLHQEPADFEVCESFEAGFSYFLGVSLLSPKWHVTEVVFPEAPCPTP
jgi:hypothetical protein